MYSSHGALSASSRAYSVCTAVTEPYQQHLEHCIALKVDDRMARWPLDAGPAVLDTGPAVLDTGPAVLDAGPAVLDTGPAVLDT